MDAGNISKRDYLAEARDALVQENHHVEQSLQSTHHQLQLQYLLGLTNQVFRLPSSLPAIPSMQLDTKELINNATRTSVDLKKLQQEITQLDKQIALVKKEYSLGDSHAGISAKKEADNSKALGPSVEMQIPLFDSGKTKLARLNAKKQQIHQDINQTALALNRDIALYMNEMSTAEAQFKIAARQQQETDEQLALTQAEVNFMLRSPFELIDLKMASAEFAEAQHVAQRRYWQAYSKLALVTGTELPSTLIETTPASEQDNKAHSHHHDMHKQESHRHD